MGKYATLASRIKELRQVAGFTQQDLSQASGLSRSYISRLEMGDIALPSRDKLRALATALGAGLDDLLLAAGFLDAGTGQADLPEIKAYLRRKYGIVNPKLLQALETLVLNMRQTTTEQEHLVSSVTGAERRQGSPLIETDDI